MAQNLNQIRNMKPSFVMAPIGAPMTWELVTQHIETAILNGVVGPGDRLPPERELARQLGVSRSILRDALKDLVERGLIRTTQGGGNYVNRMIGKRLGDPLAQLLQDNPEAQIAFMEFRLENEGGTASLAAIRATPPDIKILTYIFERMNVVHQQDDVEEEALLDADFHLAITEATHNPIMIHVGQSLRELMRQEILSGRLALLHKADRRETILRQHGDILRAIREGEPATARQAMYTHINYTTEIVRDLGRFDERQKVAQQRLSRWKGHLNGTSDAPRSDDAQ